MFGSIFEREICNNRHHRATLGWSVNAAKSIGLGYCAIVACGIYEHFFAAILQMWHRDCPCPHWATYVKILYDFQLPFLCVTNGFNPGGDARCRPWYSMFFTPQTPKTTMSDVYIDDDTNTPCVTLSYPIYSEHAGFLNWLFSLGRFFVFILLKCKVFLGCPFYTE